MIEALLTYIGANCGKFYLYFIYDFSRRLDVFITQGINYISKFVPRLSYTQIGMSLIYG